VIVVVLGLATWLGLVMLAARRPYSRNPRRERMRALVQGGQHVGGGRSVAPTRDAPVPEGGGEAPVPAAEDAALAGEPDRRPGSPMNL
jgi:hypothetical protein